MSKNIRRLTFSSICVAISIVFGMIKVFSFPFGGSVTLCSMLFIVLPAWIYGTFTGFISGLVCGLINFILNPYMISIPQVLLDYVFAFSVMGIAGIFRNKKNGLLKGYIVAVFGRWIVATFAGLMWVEAGSVITLWDGLSLLPLPYSMVYNGIYIFAEAIITIIIILVPSINNKFVKMKGELQ